MRLWTLAALLFSTPAFAAPVFNPERIVLKTDVGDMILALYAGAPRHAAKLHGLFREGAYDGVPVTKLDPSRYVAFGGVERRRDPWTPARIAVIKRLPLETGGGTHRAGVVAMAHAPADPDETGTAFVILFADIAPMDGRFSAVGEIVGGREVLGTLQALPVDGEARPLAPLVLRETPVYASGADIGKTASRGPEARALGRDDGAARRRVLLALSVVLFGGGIFLWLKGKPTFSSSGLLACLAGFFAAFGALADLSASHSFLSVALFASTVGVFRLMGRFER